MAVGINIVSDFNSKGIEKAVKEFARLETSSERAQFALSKAAIPAAAALAGLAVAAGFAVKAAIEDQAEQAKLAQILNQVTGATKQQITETEKQITSFSKVSLFTDSQLRPALANLVQGTKDVEQSQKLLALAMDISTATGTPLIAVTDALAKAENGNLMALKKLTPAVTENIKEGASLDQIYQQLTSTFGGAALSATETTAGQFLLLKNRVGELQESFGAILLPLVAKLVPLFQSLASLVENNQTTFSVFIGVIALFSTVILLLNGYLKLQAFYQKLVGIETVKTMLATETATAVTTAFGVAAKGVAFGLAALAGALALEAIFNNFSGHTKEANTNLEKLIVTTSKLGTSSGTTTQDVIKDFSDMAAHIGSKSDIIGSFLGKRLGRDFTLLSDGATVDIEHLDQAFDQLAAKSPEYAQKIVTALRNQAAQTPVNTRAFKDLTDAANRYEKQLLLAAGAQNALATGITTVGFRSAKFNEVARNQLLENMARVKGAETMQTFFNKSVSAAGSAVKTAAEKLQDYTDAIQGVTSAQRSLRDANKGVTDAIEKQKDSVAKVAKAQDLFNKVSQGYASDSKEVVRQTRLVADAQRNLFKANISTADSVQAVKNAEEALTKLREKVSPYDIESGEIALQKSKFDLEQANFAVLDAENDLAELRLDPKSSAQKIREAEIKLAESKFNVRDATQKINDAEKDLNKLRNDTPTLQEIKDAERAVADAKLASADATISQNDAQTNLNESQEKLNELINGASKDSEIYADALKELRDAQEAEADAVKAITTALERQADAVRDLAKAEKERRDAGKGISAADKKAADAAAADAAAIIAAEAAAAIGGGGGFDFGFGIVTPDDLKNIRIPSLEELLGFGVPMAKGGIVSQPTSIIAGERGAEAIIPLDRLGSMGSTYNISVTAGMGADGKDIGTQIVNALKRYERTNGALPLTVA
jgi:predicted DNA-binding ArsR family transcriptional regulator